MAKLVDINLDPDVHTLRQFGFIALGGFLVLAALAWFETAIFAFGLGEARTTVAGVLAGLGVWAALVSLIWPKANKPLFVGLSIVAFPIGFVLSYVILGTLFFLVIGPIGVVMRLVGRDPMHRRYDANAPSYWTPYNGQRPNESYFKQF